MLPLLPGGSTTPHPQGPPPHSARQKLTPPDPPSNFKNFHRRGLCPASSIGCPRHDVSHNQDPKQTFREYFTITSHQRPSRVLKGNRIGQVVAIDQRALFAQRSLNFGGEGISFLSIPRRRNPAG